MAYDSGAENLALLKRTVAGTLDFTGRSRRTELLYYLIATALVSTVFGFALMTSLPRAASVFAALALRLVLALPLFALFARRLHDQDRSGWWALILVVIAVLGVMQTLRIIWIGNDIAAGHYHPRGPTESWIGIPLSLVYLVLAFLPGTNGPNRFGPDPRLD